MATTPKKPSREEEEERKGDMMFNVHPLHPSRPSPSRKPKRENRIKNACLSNSHSNIAASNDKRPLFVQIPATSSASLVSTSLPIQCLQPSNFFFYRGIFSDNFFASPTKNFSAFATPLQVPRKTFWRLQHRCKSHEKLSGVCNTVASLTKNFLAFATLLQVPRKTFWRLQHCCKHFQNALAMAWLP